MTGIGIFTKVMRRGDEVIHNFLLIDGGHRITERKEGKAYGRMILYR